MLHTIGFFRFFCIVPPIHGADQVAGDPADPLKGDRLKTIMQINIVPVYCDVDTGKLLVRIFFSGAVNVGLLFFSRKLPAAYISF